MMMIDDDDNGGGGVEMVKADFSWVKMTYLIYVILVE